MISACEMLQLVFGRIIVDASVDSVGRLLSVTDNECWPNCCVKEIKTHIGKIEHLV